VQENYTLKEAAAGVDAMKEKLQVLATENRQLLLENKNLTHQLALAQCWKGDGEVQMQNVPSVPLVEHEALKRKLEELKVHSVPKREHEALKAKLRMLSSATDKGAASGTEISQSSLNELQSLVAPEVHEAMQQKVQEITEECRMLESALSKRSGRIDSSRSRMDWDIDAETETFTSRTELGVDVEQDRQIGPIPEVYRVCSSAADMRAHPQAKQGLPNVFSVDPVVAGIGFCCSQR